MNTQILWIVGIMLLIGTASAATDVFASVPFSGNNTVVGIYLIDRHVSGCPAGSNSATMFTNGTIINCYYNQTLVDGNSYLSEATGYTASGTVTESGYAWFKTVASPIAGLDPEFALFIALGIMMFTAMMGGITTGPAISLCFSFEGWVFYGMNMFTLIDYTTPVGSVMEALLTIVTVISILWLVVSFRRSNR
jgi:hypothetical protein